MSHEDWVKKMIEADARTPVLDLDPEEIARGVLPDLKLLVGEQGDGQLAMVRREDEEAK